MSQMTPAAARVVNPVITNVALGIQNGAMVASALFPRVPVAERAGSIIVFGKEDWMLYDSKRAPSVNTKRTAFGYAAQSYQLTDYSLEGPLPIEIIQEAKIGPNIEVQTIVPEKVLNIMSLRLEKLSADIARNASSYPAANTVTLSGSSQWSDFTGYSSPRKDVEVAKDAVRAITGRRANTVVLGARVMAKLRQHPLVIDSIRYTSRKYATPEVLAKFFDVDRVIVGDAVYTLDGVTLVDVWGNDVVVAYTEVASVADMGVPSYGYTYNLNGYPQMEAPYYDNQSKSWIFPCNYCDAPVMACPGAGYLIKNAVA